MKAVFLDLATYKQGDEHVDLLNAAHDNWVLYDGSTPDELVERMSGAELVITNKCKLTREVIEACPDLKIIIAGATGVDNIDVQAAKDKGVIVCNVRGYSTSAVAQYVFAGILTLLNSCSKYDALVKSGAWQNNQKFCLLDYDMIELSGKTIGLVGYGDIAGAVEKIALAFDMHVLRSERKGASDIRPGRAAFDDVIRNADILSLHCPLNDDTRGLIGEEELSLMKDTAILVNAARGGVADEQALADAVRDQEISGAVVDVVSQEPPRDGNPLLDPDLERVIITPHCAWASVEARLRLFEQVKEIIASYKAGAPINRVV